MLMGTLNSRKLLAKEIRAAPQQQVHETWLGRQILKGSKQKYAIKSNA